MTRLKSSVGNDWETLGKLLDEFYTTKEGAEYLSKPHPLLENRPAIEVIEDGKIGRVISVLQSMAAGNYL